MNKITGSTLEPNKTVLVLSKAPVNQSQVDVATTSTGSADLKAGPSSPLGSYLPSVYATPDAVHFGGADTGLFSKPSARASHLQAHGLRDWHALEPLRSPFGKLSGSHTRGAWSPHNRVDQLRLEALRGRLEIQELRAGWQRLALQPLGRLILRARSLRRRWHRLPSSHLRQTFQLPTPRLHSPCNLRSPLRRTPLL